MVRDGRKSVHIPTRPGEEQLQRADVDLTFDLTGWRTAVPP